MGNRATCCSRLCPKATGQPLSDELLDEDRVGGPAGAVFRETLEDLNEVDRLLLLFCSSENLAAVRWLFALGANLEVCDTNGTTCLHTACRSGPVAIVRDLIGRGVPLDNADSAGWTALHIAAFMGRRTVALELMRSGADLKRKNLRGMGPAELCSDGWLREAIVEIGAHSNRNGPGAEWQVCQDSNAQEDMAASSRLHFEPFFVPRTPVLHDIAQCGGLQRIGVKIFNQRPGQGLAFLVATSTVRDFPIELSTFLLEHDVNRAQLGEFLGEGFSLAQTLRLEFINSARLTGTGVVSCLVKVFKQLYIPADMQKIDRLIESVAQIWWRQHERLRGFRHACDRVSCEDENEFEGMHLMQQLSGHCMLYQLMFSTVLLHWSLYAPLPPSQRVTLPQWLEMNSGLGGGEEPEEVTIPRQHMQQLIYNTISHRFVPQLQIWSGLPGVPTQSSSCPTRGRPICFSRFIESPPPALPEGELAEDMQMPLLTVDNEDTLEGWAHLLGGGFPSPVGASGSTISYRHLRSIHSEATFMAMSLATPVNSRSVPHDMGCNLSLGLQLPVDADTAYADTVPPPPPSPAATLFSGHRGFGGLGCGGGGMSLGGGGGAGHHEANGHDCVWLTLRCGLLLFAPKPQSWAPYAFTHLGEVVIKSVAPEKRTFTLAANHDVSQENVCVHLGDGSSTGGIIGNATGVDSGDLAYQSEPISPQLQMVFLLPDGRWQVIELPRLEVQVGDLQQLERWVACLRVQCGGCNVAAKVSATGKV